jgi:hypothetical protein
VGAGHPHVLVTFALLAVVKHHWMKVGFEVLMAASVKMAVL